MKICLRLFTLAMLVAVPAMSLAQPAHAESTLDKILKAKKIRVAIDVGNPPFGILNKDNEPDGSDVAVARQMAKDMGVELEFVQVPSTGRIPSLLAGRADVTIASISVTSDRAKAVMYCNPNGALQIVIFGPQSTAIKTPADLVGKRIGITRATLEEATVPKMAPQGTDIVWFDEIGATIQALLSGQVDAAGMSGFAAKSVADRNPDKHLEAKFTVATAYYAAAVRPGDWDLLHWIDTWVFPHKQDGFFNQIYEKYTGLKLPVLPVMQ